MHAPGSEKPVDHRADLFAFGAVLYEMLTGKRAFDGQSQASVIAAILEREPRPVSELIPATPAALDRVVKRCLAKDPDERWQSAGDLKAELRWIADGGHSPAVRTVAVRKFWWIALAGVLALVIGAISVARLMRAPRAQQRLLRVAIPLPPKFKLDSDNTGAGLAFSPDGSTLAIVASSAQGKTQLWVRRLDASAVQPLAGTDDGSYPFWSPDGAFLGFFADGKLKKLGLPGGTAQTVCDAKDGRGAAWLTDGTIVFAPEPYGPLSRVKATGGTPTVVTHVQGPGFLIGSPGTCRMPGVCCSSRAARAPSRARTRSTSLPGRQRLWYPVTSRRAGSRPTGSFTSTSAAS